MAKAKSTPKRKPDPTIVESAPVVLDKVVQGEGAVEADPAAGGKAAVRRVVGRLIRGSELPAEFELSELPALASDNANLAWVDLSEYAAEDLAEVARMLGLHPLTVEAALESWQRPRLDSFPDHFYLSATVAGANFETLTITAGELGIWMGRNFIVTAHRRPLPFLEAALARVEQSPDLPQLHTAFVLYILLDELVGHYGDLFEELENLIEATEEKALREGSDQFLGELVHLKRYVFALGRLAEQHRGVFNAFSRPDFAFVSGPEIEPYFRDVQANLERVIDRLVAAREAVNGAFDIYVSHMAHRTNALIKVLTLISTLLLPATLMVAIAQVVLRLPLLNSPASLVGLAVALVAIPGTLFMAVLRRR